MRGWSTGGDDQPTERGRSSGPAADEQREGRYVVGRRVDGRAGDRLHAGSPARPGARSARPPAGPDLPPLPPLPSRRPGAVRSPATGPRAVRPPRPVRPAGPLVAASEPAPRGRSPERVPPGRFRRFARRYGWRAYAVPVLAVVTVVTLADLALTSPAETAGDGAGTTAAATSPAAPPVVADPPPLPPGPTGSADVDVGPTATPVAPTAASYVELGAGTVTVVDGTSGVLGSGPLRRFAVEVEDGIEVDATAFATAVEQTLGDPRSWGAEGRMSFQRVGQAAVAAGQFDFKVSLISPGSMETYCPGVGTGGYTSCRYGDRAVVNLARWTTAVPHYDGDVETYRSYVVNHEVGHALGNRHVDCPGAGQPAPVMAQQTLGLDGCTKNAWPFP